MGKHTPGPWSVIDDSPEFYRIVIGKPGDQFTIANVYGDLPEAPATARLIAASPDLLAELMQADSQMQMAAECIAAGRYDEALLHVRSLSRQRRAAIAKATA